MKRKNEKTIQIQEMMATGGWTLVEEWLENKEKEIREAGLSNIINLKSDEFLKWQAYYAGELNLIKHLRYFIKQSLETEKPQIKNILKKKYKDILG